MGFIASQSISAAELWMQLVATLAILGVVAAVSWLTVRYFRPRSDGNDNPGRMAVVSRLPLASGKNLYLVRIDNRELILGTSENNIILLGEVPRGEERTDG
jgi:flagellar biogenesis protein FliO